MKDAQARGALEAILFVAGEAVQMEDLARALEMTVLECDRLIDQIAQHYLAEQRGIEIIRIEDRVQFRTSQMCIRDRREHLASCWELLSQMPEPWEK